MKKFNFLSNLLQRVSAMSGMRAEAINYDGQPTVNRRSSMTSVQRHDNASGARVAREWLKYAAVLTMLFTLGIGNAWGTEATLTFSSGSYSNSVITWSVSNVCTIKQKKGSGQTAPNSSYVSNPRWYSGNLITVTAASGVTTFTSLVITATSASYATTLANSTYTVTAGTGSVSASASSTTVTITITGTVTAFTITMGGQSRLGTSMKINYSAGAACSYKVTLTKAAATNGSFVLKNGSATGTEIASGGTVDNCDANAVVYIVPSANTGYAVSSTPTATNSASVTADGSNYKITYTKGSSKSSTVTVTFTAQSYTVTLNKNGGSGGTASVNATYNATCPAIGGTIPTKTGYNFTGYYSGSGGTGTKVVNADLTWVSTASGYTSSGKWVNAAATTLYAGWEAKTYTVTWKVNGTTVSTASVAYNSTASLPSAPDPASYCGNKFMGWTTVQNHDAATAPSPLITSAPTITGDVTYYAVFGYYEE